MEDNNQKSFNTKKIASFRRWFTETGYLYAAIILLIGVSVVIFVNISNNKQTGSHASNRGASYDTLGVTCGGGASTPGCIANFATLLGRPSIPVYQHPIGTQCGTVGDNAWGFFDPGSPLAVQMGQLNPRPVFSAAIPLTFYANNGSTCLGYGSGACTTANKGSAACFNETNSGAFDGQYQYLANEVKKSPYGTNGGSGMIFRIGWEADGIGQWYPWQPTNTTDAAAYKAAFRRVVNVIRPILPNAKFDFNGDNQYIIRNQAIWNAEYPGDDVVDYVGIDLYNYGFGQPMNGTIGWANPDQAFTNGIQPSLDFVTNFAKSHGKQVSIPEWGLNGDPQNKGTGNGGYGGDDPVFVQRMYNWMVSLPTSGGGSLGYHAYFNTADGGVDATLTNFPNALAKFKTLFGGSSTTTVPTPTPTPTAAPTPTPAAGSQSDLVVTNVSWTPSSPIAGDAVTFKATVKNQGTGATPAGTIVGVAFAVDGLGVTWSDTDTASLAPGASVTLTANSGPAGVAFWNGTAGTHTIEARVDDAVDVNRILESNESNNRLSATLTVYSSPTPTPAVTTPDLIVSSISASPAAPVAGQNVTFSAVVKNQGPGATPAGTITGVAFSVNGQQVTWSDSNTASIAPGASVTLTANGGPSGASYWNGAAGSYTVLANADDVNRITESNETNNTASTTLTVASAPVVTPTPPAPASALTATAVSSSQINLSWTASTTAGVTYDIYRAQAGSTTAKLATVTSTSFGDTGLSASTAYSYYIVTRDSLGASSTPTSTVSATTQAPPVVSNTPGTLTGTLKNSSGSVPRRAKVSIVINGSTKSYAPTSTGTYTIPSLAPATYTVTYSAFKLTSQTYSIPIISGGTITKNVILTK